MSYKKFTKDVGIAGLTQLITFIRGFILLPIITKLLGAENYGIWTQIMVTAALIIPVASLGLPYTLVRFLAGEKDKHEIQEGIWSISAIILMVVAAVALFFAIFPGSIAWIFGGKKIFVQILAPILIFECMNQLFMNIFRAFQKFGTYLFFTTFQIIGELTLVISAIKLGYGLIGAAWAFLIIRIIVFLILLPMIIKKFGIRIPKFLKTRHHLSFGLPTILGTIASWIVASSDKYLVGIYLGTLFVGYYAPAYMVGNFIGFFSAPMGFILPPRLAKSYDENRIDEVKNYLKYSIKYFLLLAIPAVFGISILSKKILTIFTTPEIASHAYYAIPFVAFSMLFSGVWSIVGNIMDLKKKTKINGFIWTAAALLNLILNIIFIPHFGILAASVTTLLAYFLAFVLSNYYSFKEIPFEVDWTSILKNTLASLLMTLFIFWLNPIGFQKVMLAILAGAFLYFALTFLFRTLNKKELNFIKNLINKNEIP